MAYAARLKTADEILLRIDRVKNAGPVIEDITVKRSVTGPIRVNLVAVLNPFIAKGNFGL